MNAEPLDANAPSFSILIPVHNAGAYVLPTVQSVLAQAFEEWEMILVDDGSTDDCLVSIEALGHPRIRVLRQARQGAPAALRAGVRVARGRYLAFLDQDDLWLPGKLRAHWDHHQRYPHADLTFCWSSLIDAAGNELGLANLHWRGPISFEQLSEDFAPGNTSAIVIRREALERAGGFDSGFLRCYDVDLALRIALFENGNCQAVPEVLTLYRRHQGQMSRDWRLLRSEWERLLVRVREYAPAARCTRLAAGDSNMHRYFAWLAYEQRDFRSSLTLLRTAFGRSPGRALTNSRNWMLGAAAAAGLVLPRRVHDAVTKAGQRLSGWRRSTR